MRTSALDAAACMCIGLCLTVSAVAQQEAPAKADAPAKAADAPVELTVDAINAKIKTIEDSPDLDEASKTKLIEDYRRAIDHLEAADDWATEADNYQKIVQDAPNLIEQIKTELAGPPVDLKPEVPPDASLQQLEQRLAQGEADLNAERAKLADFEEKLKVREERRSKQPEETTIAKQQLEEVNKDIDSPPLPDEPPEFTNARRTRLLAKKRSIEKQLDALEQELLSFDARGELRTAQRDHAARQASQLEKLVQAWTEIVNERRRAEAAQAAKAAQKAQTEVAELNEALKALADENARLAERRHQLAGKIEAAAKSLEDVKKTLAKVTENSQNVERKVNAAGLTNAIGLLLRRQRQELPNPRDYRRLTKSTQSEIAAAQFDLFELQDERSSLADIEPIVQRIIEGLAPATTEAERRTIESAARELLNARRQFLDTLASDYQSYEDKLLDIDTTAGALVGAIESLAGFIDERILWIRSTKDIHLSDAADAYQALKWLIAPGHWASAGQTAWININASPFMFAGAMVLWIALFVSQRRMRRALKDLGTISARSISASFKPTAEAIMLTILLALVWPLIIWIAAWCVGSSLDAPEFAKAVATGLRAVTVVYFSAEILRQLCRFKGLGEAHFEWPTRSLKYIRRRVVGLTVIGIPLVFVTAMMEEQSENAWRESLGRATFIIGQFVLAFFAQRILRPVGGAWVESPDAIKDVLAHRLRRLAYPVGVGLPLLLAMLAVSGYYYTALQLMLRSQATFRLAVGLFVLNAVLLRWTLMARRKLAIDQYRKRRAAAEAQARESTEPQSDETAQLPDHEPEVDLSAISQQTRELVRSLVAIALFVGLFAVWVDVLPALNILDKVTLWNTTASVSQTVTASDGTSHIETTERVIPISLGAAGLATVVLVVTFIAGRNIPGLLEITLLKRLPLPRGSRYAVTTVSRYIITIVGLVLAFNSVGIGWAKVQWLAAAITVGLGFGLQEIFANFVSGLIILFERPMRVGDIVTIGGIEGRVSRIRMRATTIIDADRRELIVPNKDFITGQLINWTLSDQITRVVIPIGVAYGTDTKLATDLLLKIAKNNHDVLSDPPPTAIFRNFGESTLDFSLRVFIDERDAWPTIVHELHTAIHTEFRKAGIDLAFPQRDVHIRTIPPPLQIRRPAQEQLSDDAREPT